MKLYKIENTNWQTFFGTGESPIDRPGCRIIAQTPSNDAFLLLSKDTHNSLELLDTVPDGFDFTYCQEWGLTINDAVVARVVLDLRRKAYGTWESQLEKIYDDGIDSWKTAVAAVKTSIPK